MPRDPAQLALALTAPPAPAEETPREPVHRAPQDPAAAIGRPPSPAAGQPGARPITREQLDALVILHRLDPSRNMARFYRLAVERDLFGRVVLAREWGRIGSAGRVRLDEHQDEEEAAAALASLERAKRARGYGEPG